MVNDQEAILEEGVASLSRKQRLIRWIKKRFHIAIAIPSRANQAALTVFYAGLCMEMALTIPGLPTGLGLWADYAIIGTIYVLASAVLVLGLYFIFSFFYLRSIAGWVTGILGIILQTTIIFERSNWGWKAISITNIIIVSALGLLALLVSYLYAYRKKSLPTVIATVASLLCIVFSGLAIKSYWDNVQKAKYIAQYSAVLLQDASAMEEYSDADQETAIMDSEDSDKVDLSVDEEEVEQQLKLQPLGIQLAEQGEYSFTHYRYHSDPSWDTDDDSSTLYVPSTDGSTVLKDWSWTKEQYWGFTEQEIPMKGQLWIPEGEGPFPIVFIMHGNHLSEEDSSDGYGYLAELLASHGMIVSSIDANFLNYSVWSGIVDDDQLLRSWLMLAHMNSLYDEEFPADWNHVALIGHSRGGQAAAMAVDARKWLIDDIPVVSVLDKVNIQAVVAVAPTDYRVDSKQAYLRNVNYLNLHGTMDADLTESYGERQYERTTFSRAGHFKASVEIYHANHGQFNTVWGKYDENFPGALALNTADLMNGEDQRQAAKLFIHSFLQASFTGDTKYEAVFQDYRTIGEQLPLTGYVSRYSSSNTKQWYDFEKPFTLGADNDTSLTAKTIDLKGRSGGDKQNRVLWVNWEEADSVLTLPIEHLPYTNHERQISSIVVSLARAERMMDPEEEEKLSEELQNSQNLADQHSMNLKSINAADSENSVVEANRDNDNIEQADDAEAYTGLQLQLKLKAGHWGEQTFDLEPFYHILHPAAHDFTKQEWLEENIKKGKYDVSVEPLLQTYVIPISLIEQEYPRDGVLFASDVESISFIFKQEQGSMIIDALGYITEGGTYVEYAR